MKAEIRLGPDPPDRTTGVAPYRIRMDETPRGCSNDANVHSLMRVRSGSGRMSGLRQKRSLKVRGTRQGAARRNCRRMSYLRIVDPFRKTFANPSRSLRTWRGGHFATLRFRKLERTGRKLGGDALL